MLDSAKKERQRSGEDPQLPAKRHKSDDDQKHEPPDQQLVTQHRSALAAVKEKSHMLKVLEEIQRASLDKSELCEDNLLIIFQRWEDLHSCLQLLAQHVAAVGHEDIDFNASSKLEFSSMFYHDAKDYNETELESALEARAAYARNILTLVVQNIIRLQKEKDALYESLSEDAHSKVLEYLQASNDAFQQRVVSVQLQNEAFEEQNEFLKKEIKELNETKKNLDHKLYEMEVAQATKVRRLSRKKLKDSEGVPSLSRLDSTGDANSEANVEVWKALAQRRLEELSDLRKKKLNYQEQLSKLNLHPTQQSVVDSRVYKNLVSELNQLKHETLTISRRNEGLQRNIDETQAFRDSCLAQFQQAKDIFISELARRHQSFQEELEQFRQKLIVVDRERSELKLQLESQDRDHGMLISELRVLSKKQGAEILELQESLVSDKDPALVAQRLKKLNAGWEQKEADIKRLLSDVGSIPSNNEWRASALVETRTAQQKLQEKITRLTERIAVVTTEINANPELKELLDQKQAFTEKLEQADELKLALMQEIDQVQGFSLELEEKNTAFTQQAIILEQQNSRFISERVKFAQSLKALKHNSEVVASQLANLEAKCQKQVVDIQTEEENFKSFKEAVLKKEAQKTGMERKLEELNASKELARMELFEANLLLAESLQSEDSLREQLAKSIEDLGISDRITTELRQQEKKRAQDRAHLHEQDNLEVLKRQAKALNDRLLCSVCTFRHKNAIITKCSHSFCNECLTTNVKVRLRKCPGCGIVFGFEDIKPITLFD